MYVLIHTQPLELHAIAQLFSWLEARWMHDPSHAHRNAEGKVEGVALERNSKNAIWIEIRRNPLMKG